MPHYTTSPRHCQRRVIQAQGHVMFGGSGATHLAKVGLRPRYYSDRGEDALIMTTKHLTSAVFQGGFQRLKAELRQKLVEGSASQPQGLLDSNSTS